MCVGVVGCVWMWKGVCVDGGVCVGRCGCMCVYVWVCVVCVCVGVCYVCICVWVWVWGVIGVGCECECGVVGVCGVSVHVCMRYAGVGCMC